MSSPLAVQHVTKVYPLRRGNKVIALDDVSLEIKKGEIFGLLGPNGAGKTTLINCAIGLIPFDSGQIQVFGHDVIKDYVRARENIGFVYQEFALDNFFRSQAMLNFHRGANNRPFNSAIVEKLMKQLDLWQYRDKLPDQLSGGMKRRLSIAKALVHEPPLVILDEPTAGIDIEMREKTWTIIREINAQGITVLLTTHHIDEAEKLCDRIGIINFGKFVKIAQTKELISEMGQRVLYVYTQDKIDEDHIKKVPFRTTHYKHPENGLMCYEVSIDRGFDAVEKTLAWFKACGCTLVDIDIKRPSLEEVFRDIAWGKNARR